MDYNYYYYYYYSLVNLVY